MHAKAALTTLLTFALCAGYPVCAGASHSSEHGLANVRSVAVLSFCVCDDADVDTVWIANRVSVIVRQGGLPVISRTSAGVWNLLVVAVEVTPIGIGHLVRVDGMIEQPALFPTDINSREDLQALGDSLAMQPNYVMHHFQWGMGTAWSYKRVTFVPKEADLTLRLQSEVTACAEALVNDYALAGKGR